MWPSAGAPPTVTVAVEAPFRVLRRSSATSSATTCSCRRTADAQCMAVPAVTYPQVPAPVAVFIATPTAGAAPLTVNLNASASYSTGSTITSYAWNFGGNGVTASNTYNSDGTYTITLTITDSRGASDSESQTITVGSGGPVCPTITFTATDDANGGNPHRMDLSAAFTPSSTVTSGWTWLWSGAISSTSVAHRQQHRLSREWPPVGHGHGHQGPVHGDHDADGDGPVMATEKPARSGAGRIRSHDHHLPGPGNGCRGLRIGRLPLQRGLAGGP